MRNISRQNAHEALIIIIVKISSSVNNKMSHGRNKLEFLARDSKSLDARTIIAFGLANWFPKSSPQMSFFKDIIEGAIISWVSCGLSMLFCKLQCEDFF